MARTTIGLAELPEVPHFLYWLFDRTDTLLYIGITNDPKARFKHHRRHKEWWPDVDQAKTRMDCFPTREEALAAEAKAIRDKQPLYNEQHNLTVDTPAKTAVAAAKRELADSVIKRLTHGEEEYKQILKEAAECLDDSEPDWEPFTDDPVVYGSALAADRASSRISAYRYAVEVLLEALPIAQVARCKEKAIEDLRRYDPDGEPEEHEVIESAVTFLAEELGDEYLDSLDPEEARGWRATAAAMLHGNAARKYKVRHAAAYAKHVKADLYYEQASDLCTADQKHGARCAQRIAALTHFQSCPMCGPDNCSGHAFWCIDHLTEARRGKYRWTLSNNTIFVTHTTDFPTQIEEPPF